MLQNAQHIHFAKITFANVGMITLQISLLQTLAKITFATLAKITFANFSKKHFCKL